MCNLVALLLHCMGGDFASPKAFSMRIFFRHCVNKTDDCAARLRLFPCGEAEFVDHFNDGCADFVRQ